MKHNIKSPESDTKILRAEYLIHKGLLNQIKKENLITNGSVKCLQEIKI